MRLVWTYYDLEILLKEDVITVLTIEKQSSFANFMSELSPQTSSSSGNLILSENNKELSIDKNCEVIFNLFGLDMNSKKILSKLYSEIVHDAGIYLYEKTNQLNKDIIVYIDELTQKLPYNIVWELELNLQGILKAYDVQLFSLIENLLERTIEYMKIAHRLCNIKVFFFVNLKSYLDLSELNYLYEFIRYEKIYVVLVESIYRCKISSEFNWIIDKDSCIIKEMD